MKLKRYLLPFGGSYLMDSLSGLTVALALVPEAIAFALVAGVSPFVGLYAAFFMCLITAVLGGRPGMISGATGSMAVVMVSLVQQYGVNMLFATVILTGIIQILAGSLGVSQFIRMMPKPVMVGFVNGLAIVIFLAQFSQFKIQDLGGHTTWLMGDDLYLMIALVCLAMFITHYLPRLTSKIPSALAAIIIVSVITPLFNQHGFHVRVVEDMMQGASQLSFPVAVLPNIAFTLNTLKIILPYALILSTIGLAESLMTLNLIDEKTQSPGNPKRECFAQGLANIISGLFCSMGGCAMIGQSMINVSSGGVGRLSGIAAGMGLLICILFAWPLIKLIPLAALVGVMFMVVIETFEWATFSFIKKIPPFDALLIVIVTSVTVFSNLAIAVLVGIVLASLDFAWKNAKHIYAKEVISEEKIEYHISGLLFFAAIKSFKSHFKIDKCVTNVVIDFSSAVICDHSAIDAIDEMIKMYKQHNICVRIQGLKESCRQRLVKAEVGALT